MSQNILNYVKGGCEMTLMAGFDRPLNELFVRISPTDPTAEEADFGDGDPDELTLGSFDSVEDIQEAIRPFGICMPKDMARAVEEDRITRAGNRIRVFAMDGTLLQDINP